MSGAWFGAKETLFDGSKPIFPSEIVFPRTSKCPRKLRISAQSRRGVSLEIHSEQVSTMVPEKCPVVLSGQGDASWTLNFSRSAPCKLWCPRKYKNVSSICTCPRNSKILSVLEIKKFRCSSRHHFLLGGKTLLEIHERPR